MKLEQHIDSICKSYGLKYLHNQKASNVTCSTPIQDLFKADTIILEGHNRHEGLLRAMESLILRNRNIFSPEEIWGTVVTTGIMRIVHPVWKTKNLKSNGSPRRKFVASKIKDEARQDSADQIFNKYSQEISIQHLAIKVMERHALKTIKDTEEIYYYAGGIYRTGGEQIIK